MWWRCRSRKSERSAIAWWTKANAPLVIPAERGEGRDPCTPSIRDSHQAVLHGCWMAAEPVIGPRFARTRWRLPGSQPGISLEYLEEAFFFFASTHFMT